MIISLNKGDSLASMFYFLLVSVTCKFNWVISCPLLRKGSAMSCEYSIPSGHLHFYVLLLVQETSVWLEEPINYPSQHSADVRSKAEV